MSTRAANGGVCTHVNLHNTTILEVDNQAAMAVVSKRAKTKSSNILTHVTTMCATK